MKHLHLSALALILGLLFSACGGGGGGRTARAPVEPPVQPTIDTQTAFQGDGTSRAFPGASRLFAAFDDDEPTFGSVVQSFGAGVSPVTGADTTFTGDRFTLRLNRQNGSSTVLDSNQDEVAIVTEYTPATNPVSNRPAVDGYISRVTTNGGVAVGVGVEWSNTDVTDYIAGGYWLYADLGAGAVELGAFIDGPAFDDVALTLPATGTATYQGRAAGLYVGLTGTDAVAPVGTFEQGEYGGSVRLTADFGANQISGRIDNIGVENVNVIYPNGVTNFVPYTETDYALTMNPVSISPNGQFGGRGLSLTHPDAFFTTSGSWGGRFSNVQDSRGNPRAVAGTHAGYGVSTGGSEAIFTGAFYAATERFE